MFYRVFLIFVTVFIASCSTVNKVGVSQMSKVLIEGSDELLYESNYWALEKSGIANLKLIEGLWFTQKENKRLLTLLIKGYAAYAYAINETEYLSDSIQSKKISHAKDQAIYNYERAVYYGVKYLELVGVNSSVFWSKAFVNNFTEISKSFSKDDEIAFFYLAQALGGSINLQRNIVSRLSYFGHAKNLSSWVCQRNPKIENGACELMSAVLEASTPRVMGGSMSRAGEKFKNYMQKYNSNYLGHVSYIQYYLIPMYLEEDFYIMVKDLKIKLASWKRKTKWAKDYREIKNKKFNLYNAVAAERLKIILRNKKHLF